MTAPSPGSRPRLGILSFSSGEFDARSFRIARSAIAAGYHVTMYTRWHPGQQPVEERDGYRLIRAPFDWRFSLPWMRRRLREEARRAMAEAARMHADAKAGDDSREEWPEAVQVADDPAAAGAPLALRIARLPFRIVRRVIRRVRRVYRRWTRVAMIFPLRPMGWAVALEDVVEPADVWHGMWAGSLPALVRVRRLHGGRTIYDS